MTAATGLLAAERHRTRTGVSQHVNLALADVAFAMVANLRYLTQTQVLYEDRPPIGNEMYVAFRRDFATLDGRQVMVVGSLRRWQSLVETPGIGEHSPAIERALDIDLHSNGDQFVARDALAALIASRTLAEVANDLERHGACWAPYQTFRQFLDDDWRTSGRNPVFADILQPAIGQLGCPDCRCRSRVRCA